MTDEQAKKVLLGEWIAISGVLWIVAAAVILMLCGCEDDGDTIYQAGDINIPTNSTTPVIISSGNSGDTDIKITQYDETGKPIEMPSVVSRDNDGNTSVEVELVSKPAPPPEEDDEE